MLLRAIMSLDGEVRTAMPIMGQAAPASGICAGAYAVKAQKYKENTRQSEKSTVHRNRPGTGTGSILRRGRKRWRTVLHGMSPPEFAQQQG